MPSPASATSDAVPPGDERPVAPDVRPAKRQKLRDSGDDRPARRHGSAGDGTRKRRKTACQSCRMRKIKCDGDRPRCALCQASHEECVYIDPLPERLTLESATSLICGKLAELETGLLRLQHPEHGRQQHPAHEPLERQASFTAILEHSESEENKAIEAAKDFLQIPAQRTTIDAVLRWDVFEGRFPESAAVSAYFSLPPGNDDDGASESLFSVPGGICLAEEERFPSLIDSFLRNVHTKNPVLDAEQLIGEAKRAASNGLGWGAWSCLVLLTSALGLVAKPFVGVQGFTDSLCNEWSDTAGLSDGGLLDTGKCAEEMHHAESHFILACRRLGGLKPSLVSVQCYFFAGVYLMYTLRPLLSWQYFHQASTMYQLTMKARYNLHSSGLQPLSERSAEQSSIARRLEESLYWSCFKSECEFRVELPLPQSEVATYHHPQLFPSPPLPARTQNGGLPSAREDPLSADATRDTHDKLHGVDNLCNEEESWYYYLTEIALRRIGNRIINTFFRQEPVKWMDIKPLLGIALEFDTQLSAWSANLPSAMKTLETSRTIRNPMLAFSPSADRSHVSRELSWALENRLLEARSWLYQPFLYWLIHYPIKIGLPSPTYPRNSPPPLDDFLSATNNLLDAESSSILYSLIVSGIDCNLRILDLRSIRHRHHGLWFDLRSAACASVVLLAILKSGNDHWIPSDSHATAGGDIYSRVEQPLLGRKLDEVLVEHEYWVPECPQLMKQRDVLKDAIAYVRKL